MSSFEDIASETLVVHRATLGSAGPTDGEAFQRELLDAVGIALQDPAQRPRTLARLLRRACLEADCRGVLLALGGKEAQDVVDVIQLVRCVWPST
jgi:hypothetical protein